MAYDGELWKVVECDPSQAATLAKDESLSIIALFGDEVTPSDLSRWISPPDWEQP